MELCDLADAVLRPFELVELSMAEVTLIWMLDALLRMWFYKRSFTSFEVLPDSSHGNNKIEEKKMPTCGFSGIGCHPWVSEGSRSDERKTRGEDLRVVLAVFKLDFT